MQQVSPNSVDMKMMTRCIELSRTTRHHGEFPFACIICRKDRILVETTNRVARDRDVTRHAELLAISEAQRFLGTLRLANCTLYSNVEPCAMCSMAIRETGIHRVVFAISSPAMGGFSRWNVLEDDGLSKKMPFFFRSPPEVVAGLLAHEAELVWSERHPLLWEAATRRGCLGSR